MRSLDSGVLQRPSSGTHVPLTAVSGLPVSDLDLTSYHQWGVTHHATCLK